MNRITGITASTAVALAIATLLSGCQATSSPEEPPPGVKVSIYQPRTDISLNRIAINFDNQGAEPLTITSAILTSNFFANEFVWSPAGPTTVPPGFAIDLRVNIPLISSCDESKSENSVRFDWRVGEVSGTSVVRPEDTFGILDSLHANGCFVAEIQSIASISAVSLTPPAEGPAPAILLISIIPTGKEGTVTVNSVGSTTLLNPADSDGIGSAQLDIGVVIDANGPYELEVPLVPNRCDQHAIAEDKVGTRIPLIVTLANGTEGRLVLPASDQLRTEMYSFFTSFCGL